jgi:hypothetical protein
VAAGLLLGVVILFFFNSIEGSRRRLFEIDQFKAKPPILSGIRYVSEYLINVNYIERKYMENQGQGGLSRVGVVPRSLGKSRRRKKARKSWPETYIS